jgi:citrate lyase beta subunit
MVESARDIAIIASVLALESPVIVPLVETASALRAAAEIARSDKVAAMMFGGGDLSADIGVELAWEPLIVARGQFVLACAGAEIGIIDVPFIRLDDASGLEEEAQKAKALGFTAKAAIHPAQLPAIRQAFGPTEAQIQEARDAVEAFRLAGGKAVRHQGRMLEAPLMRRYEEILSSQEKLDA